MERDNEVFLKQTPPVSPVRNSPTFNSNNNGTTPCSLIDSGVFGSELDKASNRSISDSDSIHSSIYNYNQNSPTHGTTWREIDSKKTSKRDPLVTSLYQNFLNIPELTSPTVKTIIPMEDDTSSEASSGQLCEEEEEEEEVQKFLDDGNETLIINPTMETSYHWDEYIPSNNWNSELPFEINDIMNISIHNDFDLFNYSTNLNDSLPFIGEEQIDYHNILNDNNKKCNEGETMCNIFKLILSPVTNYILSNNNITDDTLFISPTSKCRHNKGNKKKGNEENSINKLYQFVKEYFNSNKIKIITGVRKENPETREKVFEKMIMKLHQYQRRLGQNLYEDEDLWKGKKEISKLHELGELIQFKILINKIVINKNLKIEKNMFEEEKLFDIAEDWFSRIFIQNPIETFLNINLCKVIMKDIINKQNKKNSKCNNNEKLKLQFMLLQQIYDLHYTNIPSMINNSKIEGIHLLPPIEDLEILRKFLNDNFQTFSLPAYYPPFGGRWRRSLSRTKDFWLMITKNACISLFLGISFLFITSFFNNWFYQTCCQDGSANGWIFGLTLKKTGNGIPPM